jgi:hypothetical protein
LEKDARRRDDNTIIAKELLPIFLADGTAWRAVRKLHAWPQSSVVTLGDFMGGWAEACPVGDRNVVASIAATLQIAVDTTPTVAREAGLTRLSSKNATALDG